MLTDWKKEFNLSYPPTPAELHGDDLPTKEPFYQILKIMKFLKDFSFEFQQVNSRKLTEANMKLT
jgi:hypothetical protein